ncbi:class II glutamine amidotransferase [Nocardia sp. 2]|uniref:Gamma-glutamyl-hercynylcysteine sulfoxide hydrolase n=1 Tax=Nocardia acididurans TaxID=2802282 RepID=A0ABS1MFW9_9NOCA|nr:class II glutamine amidotransferase [Nocardia acididurans]MBL1079557.1 class II glutamine amidotransferase [Nocardia acididurans]
MCRHLAYLGPPTPVGELLTRGPHSLRTQSWAPREMRGGGTINADGFGVAWWLPAEAAPEDHGAGVTWHGGARPDPVDEARAAAAAAQEHPAGAPTVSRYRNAAPIWTDPAVEEVLPQLRSRAVLAAIRSATVGMPVERAACAPFTYGRWAFSHNGAIPDWRRALSTVAAQFDSPSLLEAEALTDSAALWVILRRLLERGASHPGAAAAPDDVLRRVTAAVLAESPRARLNLLLGDGETIWATTWHHSLSVRVTDEYAVVASEPYDDDPRWEAIGDRMLVRVRPGWKSVDSLENELGRATS